MIELKFIIPPFIPLAIFAEQFLSGLPSTLRLAIDLAAICTLAAGFLVLGRLRGALAASEASADAWKGERDAAVARADRHRDEITELRKEKEEEGRDLLSQISDLRVEITKLQERPTLEVLASKLDVVLHAIEGLKT
jgi:hypothetical protein